MFISVCLQSWREKLLFKENVSSHKLYEIRPAQYILNTQDMKATLKDHLRKQKDESQETTLAITPVE